MTTAPSTFVTSALRVTALALAMALAPAAFAADVVFPPGVRVGVAPLPGLSPALGFAGLESGNETVKVLMTELPPAAYTEVEATLKANPASPGATPEPMQTAAGPAFLTVESAKVGDTAVKRYAMILPGSSFSGYVAVQVADNAGDAYSEDAIKSMLATAAVRSEVPREEQIGMMPFNLTELSDFKTFRTLAPGAAILIADATGDTPMETAPFMMIGTIAGAPDKAEERARFAQQAVAEIPGLREGRVTMAEPVRIDGAPGYETRVDAVSGKDSTPVSVVQWLRFGGGGGGALRIIASTPRDQWAAAFPRFRAVRDGLQGK